MVIEHEYEGRVFKFKDTRTAPLLIKEIFGDNYKVRESRLLLNADDVILDIGANEGIFALFMAHLFPETTIYAIEPVLDTYLTLKENIMLNEFTNIEPYCFGVGAPGHKRAVLNVSKDFSGGSTAKCAFVESDHNQVEVELASMDDVLKSQLGDRFDHLNEVALMKMDIEGMEYEALYPATRLGLIKNFVGEFHMNMRLDCEGRRPGALVTWLTNQGINILHIETCMMAE